MFETFKKTLGICKKIAKIVEDDENPLLKLKDVTFIDGNGNDLFIKDYEFDLESCDGYDEPDYLTSKAQEALEIGDYTILLASKDGSVCFWVDPLLNRAQRDPGYEDEDIVQIRCPVDFFKRAHPQGEYRSLNPLHTIIRTVVDEDRSIHIGKVFTIATIEIKDHKIVSTKLDLMEFNENTANDIVKMIRDRG